MEGQSLPTVPVPVQNMSSVFNSAAEPDNETRDTGLFQKKKFVPVLSLEQSWKNPGK